MSLAAFAAVVLGGCFGSLQGAFTANTLRNWLDLLLLLPTVVALALRSLLQGRIVYIDGHERSLPDPERPECPASAAA